MKPRPFIAACLAGLFTVFTAAIALGTTATASGLKMTDEHARTISAAEMQVAGGTDSIDGSTATGDGATPKLLAEIVGRLPAEIDVV